MADLAELSDERWQRGLDINLVSALRICREVIPVMLRQRRGAIGNISSLASMQINQYPYLSYFSAKAALNQFTRAIAVRYAADGIRATAVLPGVIETQMVEKQSAGQFVDSGEMRRVRSGPMRRYFLHRMRQLTSRVFVYQLMVARVHRSMKEILERAN
jgi:NAD(P)-dependent dehydrogenase (short-subunit alcohol dehydrogenase family)